MLHNQTQTLFTWLRSSCYATEEMFLWPFLLILPVIMASLVYISHSIAVSTTDASVMVDCMLSSIQDSMGWISWKILNLTCISWKHVDILMLNLYTEWQWKARRYGMVKHNPETGMNKNKHIWQCHKGELLIYQVKAKSWDEESVMGTRPKC